MALKVSISEVSDVNERLKPLRKMLADIDEAVQYTSAVMQSLNENEAKLAGFRTDIQKLIDRKASLETAIAKLNTQHQERIAALGEQYRQKEIEYRALIDSKYVEIRQIEKDCEARAKAAEETYQKRFEKAKALADIEEKRLTDAQSARDAFLKRVAAVG